MGGTDELERILRHGSAREKIGRIGGLAGTDEPDAVRLLISCLDDGDIRVRGEAFGALVLNENAISGQLVEGLASGSRHVRGFSALILANRNERDGIPDIIGLTGDPSASVRSCALGALGFLRAGGAAGAVRGCLSDPDIEVRKSALAACVDLGESISREEAESMGPGDDEMRRLVSMCGKA